MNSKLETRKCFISYNLGNLIPPNWSTQTHYLNNILKHTMIRPSQTYARKKHILVRYRKNDCTIPASVSDQPTNSGFQDSTNLRFLLSSYFVFEFSAEYFDFLIYFHFVSPKVFKKRRLSCHIHNQTISVSKNPPPTNTCVFFVKLISRTTNAFRISGQDSITWFGSLSWQHIPLRNKIVIEHMDIYSSDRQINVTRISYGKTYLKLNANTGLKSYKSVKTLFYDENCL